MGTNPADSVAADLCPVNSKEIHPASAAASCRFSPAAVASAAPDPFGPAPVSGPDRFSVVVAGPFATAGLFADLFCPASCLSAIAAAELAIALASALSAQSFFSPLRGSPSHARHSDQV